MNTWLNSSSTPRPRTTWCLPSSRGIVQLKNLGVLQKVNKDWVPNATAYLPEWNKKIWYDPDNQYGIPTDSYFFGYSYNTKYVKPDDPRIGSWALLFEGDDFKGRLTMLDEMFAVIGIALKYKGYSYNSDDEGQLAEIREILLKQKENVMAYDSWPKRLVLEEEAWVSNCWVGDSWFYNQEMDTIQGKPAQGRQRHRHRPHGHPGGRAPSGRGSPVDELHHEPRSQHPAHPGHRLFAQPQGHHGNDPRRLQKVAPAPS